MDRFSKDRPDPRRLGEPSRLQVARSTSGTRSACTAVVATLLFAACGNSDGQSDVVASGGRTARGGASATTGGTLPKGGTTARGSTVPRSTGGVGNTFGGSTAVETGGTTTTGGTTGGSAEGGSGGTSIVAVGGTSSGGTTGTSFVVGGAAGSSSDCVPPSKPPGNGEVLSFNAAHDYPTQANYVGLPFDLRDIDHDGYLDVVMALTNNGRIALLRGTSEGTLGTATEMTVSAVNHAWLEDLNADGNLDLLGFENNLSQNRALVALGNGNGTFQTPTPIFNLSNHGNVQFYNLVGDASTDLIVGHNSNGIQIYSGDGLGGFTLSSTLTTSGTIRDYIVMDLDGDPYKDLVVASTGGTSTQQLEVAWGLAAGSFSALSKFDLSTLIGQTSRQTTDLLVGDVNQDKIQDLVIVDDLGVSLLLGSVDRTPVFRQRTTPLANVSGSVLADLDNDGHLDLVLSNSNSGLLTFYYGIGNGSFSEPFEYTSGNLGSVLRAGDIDADGNVDLVLSAGAMTVVRNLGARQWQAAPVIRRGTSPTLVRLSDLNHDGRLDLLSVDGTNFLVSLGDGTGKFAAARSYAIGEKPVDIEFVHANADGHLDVAFTTTTSRLGLLYGDGTGGLTTGGMIDAGLFLAVGDVDEDGQSELLTANYTTLFVHEVFGTNTWTTTTAYVRPKVGSSYPGFSNLVLSDLNRDQHLDAVLSGSETKDITLLRGAGDKSFVLDRFLNASYSVYETLPADFTGDCRPDLMVAHTYGTGSLLFFSGLPNAEWSPSSNVSAVYGGELLGADLDSDGWLDATLTHWSSIGCQVKLNRGGGTFESRSFNCKSAERHAIGDLNGDRRPDFVYSHNSSQYLSIVLNTSKPDLSSP